ncbi:hypothetical protein BDV98DRAFT_527766, partial [Pterulicium gracile]
MEAGLAITAVYCLASEGAHRSGFIRLVASRVSLLGLEFCRWCAPQMHSTAAIRFPEITAECVVHCCARNCHVTDLSRGSDRAICSGLGRLLLCTGAGLQQIIVLHKYEEERNYVPLLRIRHN